MKKLVVGLVACLLIAGGCGAGDAADEVKQNTTASEEAEAEAPALTEDELSASWYEERSDQALKISDKDTAVEVVEAECVITDAEEGKARCTETAKFQSLDVLSVKSTEQYIWDVRYDTESAEILSYR